MGVWIEPVFVSKSSLFGKTVSDGILDQMHEIH